MNLEEVEKVVARLQRTLFRNANAYTVGMLKSHLKGSGLQFKEHQVYVHGDDVRFIDWKMLAKTNSPYIKTFEEERNVEIVAMIDLSPTMLFGYQGKSKLQASVEIVCLLYLLAQQSNDSVTTILCHKEQTQLPKSVGKKGIVYLIAELQKIGVLSESGVYNYQFNWDGKPDLKRREATIKECMAKKKEVIIFSDFYSFVDLENNKSMFVKKNVHPFRVVSPIDVQTKRPFALFGRVEKEGKIGSGFVNSDTIENLSYKEKKYKYKTLNVEKDYLEDFVRELM